MNKLLTLYFLFIGFLLHAQEQPIKFLPGLISDGGSFGLTLSPDGKEAFWVRSNGLRDSLVIMQSRKVNQVWTRPEVASFSTKDGSWKDIDPVFSPDGAMVLFQSTRPVPGHPGRKGFDIWAVKKTPTGWYQPYHLDAPLNSDASESYASMANNGNIYFTKDNGNNQSDIYLSEYMNGKYSSPVNLGNGINTKQRESNPFISPGEDYLIYFSTDESGFGETDLFISFNKRGNWSQPKNLGKPINSGAAEFCPFVHVREKRLYFTRQYRQGDRLIENIFYVPFDPKKYEMGDSK
ncbi:MAG: hypothetical protein ABIT96_07850 [Ferruginibacter sp.]